MSKFKIGDKVLIGGTAPGVVVRVGAGLPGYLVQLEGQSKDYGRPRVIRCHDEHLIPDSPAGRALFAKPGTRF